MHDDYIRYCNAATRMNTRYVQWKSNYAAFENTQSRVLSIWAFMHHYNYRSPSFCPFSDLNFRISYMVRCISDLVRYQLRLVVRIVIRWPITAVTRPSKPPAITYHKKKGLSDIGTWTASWDLCFLEIENVTCNSLLFKDREG
jgi:hypothetical protein